MSFVEIMVCHLTVRTKRVNIMEYHDMGYANAGMFLDGGAVEKPCGWFGVFAGIILAKREPRANDAERVKVVHDAGGVPDGHLRPVR
ncbi:hypothetical protein C9I56_24425 [Paraburkholderia caribensis]|uniref:Uncharacterized protein n=1 Tax=Paraburkholderia caribensis TaxID=75105 RepID=A0A9Q6S9I0_9BURK|nr:hypothetical protein C9I56_24425 [Paraburkholderia caribensis]QLB67285.1 hypothetical protein A9O66_33035 [Paraburkholderia caribensis]